jgi:light-regulated signal transduction histidine kinase (bacteriophytochrome)
MEFMQNFDIKAKLAVPILLKEQLWGLLVAHQCNRPRHWSSFETDLLKQLADQIGIALAQAQLLEQETHQRQELARSNTELENFARVASHDLQEPLRKILTFGERLQTKYGEVLTEQGYDYLERMHKAAERMQTLIHDLLTLSRITTQAQPFVAVDLAQIVQDVLSDLEVCLEQTQGQVEVGELPTLNSDPLQMRQLMQNLIGNALKFHRKGEPPKVRIYSQPLKGENQPALGDAAKPTHCQICVEDNGIGFDTQYLERIFQAFHRLHGRNDYEGTGMGLAICRKIAERHNGSISAHSTQGQGSTFIVTLPLQKRQ